MGKLFTHVLVPPAGPSFSLFPAKFSLFLPLHRAIGQNFESWPPSPKYFPRLCALEKKPIMNTMVLYVTGISLFMYGAEPKKVLKTWSDRLTGKNNLWLEATNTEDDGNFPQATMLYLKDATRCWEAGLKARAALSCSCAASCFVRTNNPALARILYAESAFMYEEFSKDVIGKSIREAFWALQRAYENYILAGNEGKAQEVFMRYTSLSMRISPFFGKEEAMKILGFKEAAGKNAIVFSGQMRVTVELLESIERFLEIRRGRARLSDRDRALMSGKIGDI